MTAVLLQSTTVRETVFCELHFEIPLNPVTVSTVEVDGVSTRLDEFVPVLHVYEFAPAALKLALPPIQISVFPDTVNVGEGLTITETVPVEGHRLPFCQAVKV